MSRYPLVFDDVMIKQLQKAAKNNQVKQMLTRMLDKLEEKGQQRIIEKIRRKSSES